MNQVMKDTPPIFINNLTLMLSRKTMPAITSDVIKKEIWVNANNWKEETLSSLKKHYNRVIKEQLRIIFDLPDREWQHPFKTASKWAKTKQEKGGTDEHQHLTGQNKGGRGQLRTL